MKWMFQYNFDTEYSEYVIIESKWNMPFWEFSAHKYLKIKLLESVVLFQISSIWIYVWFKVAILKLCGATSRGGRVKLVREAQQIEKQNY